MCAFCRSQDETRRANMRSVACIAALLLVQQFIWRSASAQCSTFPLECPPFQQTDVPVGQRQDLNDTELDVIPLPYPIPESGDVKVHVYFIIEMNKVSPVDTVGGTFLVDFYIITLWRDDRYAALDGTPLQSRPIDIAGKKWFAPQPTIVNIVSGQAVDSLSLSSWTFNFVGQRPDLLNETPIARDEPDNAIWLSGSARAHVSVSVPMDMREFPYDKRDIQIVFEDGGNYNKYIIYHKTEALLEGLHLEEPANTAIDGWTIVGYDALESTKSYNVLGTLSRLTVSTFVVRQGNYWTTRVVLGVVLFVLMAIFTQALSSSEPARQVVTVTCFLGMVSWQFVLVLALDTPLGYNTRIDSFMTMSFVITFLLFSVQSLHLALTPSEAPASSGGASAHPAAAAATKRRSAACDACMPAWLRRLGAMALRRCGCTRLPLSRAVGEPSTDDDGTTAANTAGNNSDASGQPGGRLGRIRLAIAASAASLKSAEHILSPVQAEAVTHRAINVTICIAFIIIYTVSTAVCFLSPIGSFYTLDK